MIHSIHYYRTKLNKLERLRRDLARKLDRLYARDNISDFISLEKKYCRVIATMDRVRAMMSQVDAPHQHA
ncbi:hypothetical protein CR970_00585 [Candidatus Saccharibacteria bacterium]|nr:MAG: hypothetical protein CR970_00585 [Candidatus Saccharibacteria bacterium]